MVTRSVGDRSAATAVGLLADLVVGDPPSPWHPVAWFGTTMTRVERRVYRDAVAAGAAYALAGVGLARLASLTVPSAAIATTVCSAGRGLTRSAHAIERELAAGDLAGAQKLLPSLVGRDAALLDEAGVVRAVVESVAENTVDAIVAPACWALVAGSTGAFGHRAVNTMDAMVGHRSPRYLRFGRVAARLDDAAAWAPARITALLVSVVRPATAPRVLDAVRRQAPAHPSPNAGVAEAAFAAALGIQLGGPTSYDGYVDRRPLLGNGRAPQPRDIRRATALSRDLTITLITVLGAIAATSRRAR